MTSQVNPSAGIPYAVILGAAAGVLCSSVTHAILMIHYEEPSPLPLLGGAGFGIYAGCLLGLLGGALVKARCKEDNLPASAEALIP